MNEKDAIFDNFKRYFESMTHEERDKYLRKMGLEFEYIDSSSRRKTSLWKDTVIVKRVGARANKMAGKRVKGSALQVRQVKLPKRCSVFSQLTASNKSRQSNATHEEVEEQVGKKVDVNMK